MLKPVIGGRGFCGTLIGLAAYAGLAWGQDPAPAEETPPTPPPYEQTVPVPAEAPASAEATAEKGSTKLGVVEVTGSRLKRTDYETAAPVAVISREDIDRSGLTSISEILMHLTAAGNDSLQTQAQSVFITGGESNLDLRNLGPQHTLVLVNGRRWVTGLISTEPSVVDLNTIPTSIIERVEILKDGASAVYGSDAIAGVVNIITRKDYSGVGFSSQYGSYYDQHDGAQVLHQISWGTVGPSTSLFANASYTEERVAWATNRHATSAPVLGAGVTRWGRSRPQGRFVFVPTPENGALFDCPSLTADVADSVLADPGGNVGPPFTPGQIPGQHLPPNVVAAGAKLPVGVQVCDLTLKDGASGTSPLDFRTRSDVTARFNYFQGAALINPSKRAALFTQFTQNIFDWASFAFEGFYNYRKSSAVIGNFPILGGNLYGFTPNAFASVSNQYNPLLQDIGQNTTVSAPDPIGNTTVPLIGSGIFSIRDLKVPSYSYGDYVNTLRLAGGFKGDFSVLDHGFSWDLGYVYAGNRSRESVPFYRNDKLKLAVGPASACTGTCVPFDLFQGNPGITQAMVDYVFFDPVARTNNRQDIAYADFSTDLGWISLPAGPTRVAAGFEYRRDQYKHVPDPVVASGVSILNAEITTEGKTSVKEEYVELGIPLLKDLPLINALDIDIAGRHSNYDRFGGVNTGKAGLRWKPYEDLLLRGTYSSGFRAPNVGELFLGPSQSFNALADPCVNKRADPTVNANCNADGVPSGVTQPDNVYQVFGGNPKLKPETSRGMTYGLVFSPHFVRDLNITVDYYRVRLKGFITVPAGQFFLDSCYLTTQRSYCDFVKRHGDGSLNFVDTPFINYNAVNTAGVDSSIDYHLPVPAEFGKFKIVLDTSYLIQFDQVVPVPGQPSQTTGYAGQSQFFNAYPRWKANASLVWKASQFSASWETRMVYHQDEPCTDALGPPSLAELGLCSDPKIDAQGNDVSTNRARTIFYHSAQIGYQFEKFSTEITLGVNNVLNTDPPPSYNTGSSFYNYDPTQYETPGRFGYARLAMKF